MNSFSLSNALAVHTRKKSHNPTQTIVISFLIVILVGTLVLMQPICNRDGQPLNFSDALFTATSATCVTGLVVCDTYTQFSPLGQVVVLLLIQIGGLGLVTLTAFFNVAIGRRLGFKSLRLASESIDISDPSKARGLLVFVVKVALWFELGGAVLLSFAYVPRFGLQGLFVALFTSISAFCNAGFDILGFIQPCTSLSPCSNEPYVLTIVSILIISGGLGFLVWKDLAEYHRTKRLRTHTKLVLLMTAILLVVGTVGLAVLEWNNPYTLGGMSVRDKIWNAAFQSVSARTAGFASIPLEHMAVMTKSFSVALMLIGAAPGGTGGGIKVTTLGVILVAVVGVLRGQDEANIFGRRLDHRTVYKSLTILVLSAFAVVAASTALFYNTGTDISELDSLYEAVSAFATVGNSVGVTQLANPFARMVLILTMFVGRVGPVSMGIALASQRPPRTVRRAVPPTADISVG